MLFFSWGLKPLKSKWVKKKSSSCYYCGWYVLGFAWFAWTKRIRWPEGGFLWTKYQISSAVLECKPTPLKIVRMRKNICVVLTQGDAGEPGLPGTIGSSGKTVIMHNWIFKTPLKLLSVSSCLCLHLKGWTWRTGGGGTSRTRWWTCEFFNGLNVFIVLWSSFFISIYV